MFDIMEDLKENTQKKIMEKLVLSAALGMFCYCSNNASTPKKIEPPKEKEITNNNNIINDEDANKRNEKTKEKKQDEECCPCCCCCCEKTKPVEGEKKTQTKETISAPIDNIEENKK